MICLSYFGSFLKVATATVPCLDSTNSTDNNVSLLQTITRVSHTSLLESIYDESLFLKEMAAIHSYYSFSSLGSLMELPHV